MRLYVFLTCVPSSRRLTSLCSSFRVSKASAKGFAIPSDAVSHRVSFMYVGRRIEVAFNLFIERGIIFFLHFFLGFDRFAGEPRLAAVSEVNTSK